MTACSFFVSTELYARRKMAARKKPRVSPRIIAKARQVLEFAEKRATKAADRFELSNPVQPGWQS
jgi:hypothetical protein